MQKNSLKHPKRKIVGAIFLEVISMILLLLVCALRKGSKSKIQKAVVVIEPFGLGDSISISSLGECLKKKHPNHRIIAIINEKWIGLFVKISTYDRVIGVKLPWSCYIRKYNFLDYNINNFMKLKSLLNKYDIEYAYEVRGDIREQILLKWIGAKKIISWNKYQYSNMVNIGLLLYERKKIPCNLNRVQLNHLLTLNSMPEDSAETSKYNTEINSILIHVGARWKYKLWRKENWERLLNKVTKDFSNLNISVISGLENETYKYLKDIFSSQVSFEITSLNALYDVVNSCDLFVGIDSGVVHLAALLGKQIIDLVGPGLLPLWEPNGSRVIIIHHQNEFACAPCLQTKCIHLDRNCMDVIEVNEVFEAISRFVDNK